MEHSPGGGLVEELAGVTDEEFLDALWAGDVDRLQEIAPCRCCCWEHTFTDRDARYWSGCRSGLAPGESWRDIHQGWARWYAEIRGMTEAEFFGRQEAA